MLKGTKESNPRLKSQVNGRNPRLLRQQFPLTGTTSSGGGGSEGREPKCFSSFILCFRFMLRFRWGGKKKKKKEKENSDFLPHSPDEGGGGKTQRKSGPQNNFS